MVNDKLSHYLQTEWRFFSLLAFLFHLFFHLLLFFSLSIFPFLSVFYLQLSCTVCDSLILPFLSFHFAHAHLAKLCYVCGPESPDVTNPGDERVGGYITFYEPHFMLKASHPPERPVWGWKLFRLQSKHFIWRMWKLKDRLYLSLLIVLLSSRLRAKCLMLENPAFLITSTRTVQLVFPSFFLSDMTVYTAHDGINIKKKNNCFTTNCLFTRKICCITKIMNQK